MIIKKNFLGKEVVISDAEKQVRKKPYDYAMVKNTSQIKSCPFCKIEQEEPEKIIFRDKKDWGVVVVPNKYPYVEDSYVIVHKNHHQGFENASYVKEFEKASKFMIKKAIEEGKYAMIFKNKGFLAGASLEHAHEQAILLKREEKPKINEGELADYIEKELGGERAINSYSFCPEASIRSYEIWVILEGKNALESKGWERISSVFNALSKVIRRENFDYNAVLYYSEKKVFPPFIQMFPRYSPMAGLEIALGRYINPILPEKAASKLRSAFKEGDL